jgi:hypothetical protein
MPKISQYKAYFEQIATKYVPISHTEVVPRFVMMSVEEVISKNRKNLSFAEWTLVLFKPRFKHQINDSRLARLVFEAGFEIIKENPRSDEGVVELQDEALDYCLEILAKMLRDKERGELPLETIEENSIDGDPIESEFGSCVGHTVTFTYSVGFAKSKYINPINWLP